jgi:hypothetical protein
MSATTASHSPASIASGGRAAAIARRRALSAGKAALPPAAERVRNGERSAALPAPSAPIAPTASTAPVAAAPGFVAPATRHLVSSAPPTASGPTGAVRDGLSGRLASMERRRLLAAGKQGLGKVAPQPPLAPPPAATESAPPGSAVCTTDGCRQQARARRAAMSARGRGDASPAPPTRPPREGRLQYAPKVVASATHAQQTVTGLRIGAGSQVTGVEAGASLPVSGTQYIGADGGATIRSGGPKVGLARTVHGGIVSGTLIRSSVPVTGDEAGGTVTITGESEQRPEDDLTDRGSAGAPTSAQFQRQVDPHGHSVFGTNLGRSAGHVGSRERRRQAPLESTETGLAITGSAVGRATRVTGDEDGACRHITGDQYLSPARAQAECGGSGGGTAPAAQIGSARRDPVTGAKVSVAQTWGQQRITGADVEHNPRVTGDAPGSCSLITGTPYQGPHTLHGWCDPAQAAEGEERLPRRQAASPVTGDTPVHGGEVTGTARGAARSITGTPYYRAEGEVTPPSDPVAAMQERFSVQSPQRTAHLRADRSAAGLPSAAGRITGSFALGGQKVTGNQEFAFTPRRAADAEAKPAHLRISGEGRTAGARISGDSWLDQTNVTGTEGFTAAERNPSERDGKPQAFAGAGRFKALAHTEERKQLVTGMFGWSSKSAAKVTLSGGAQG